MSTHPTSFVDDNILCARAELLEILTKGIAPAIAAALWEAAKLAEGVMTALNILAPLPVAEPEPVKEPVPLSLGSTEGKFCKKTGETVSAVLYTGFPASSKEVNFFVGKAGPVNRAGFQRIEAGYIAIPELPDGTRVFPGDWVVKNAVGEFAVCKPDIFAATHEAA